MNKLGHNPRNADELDPDDIDQVQLIEWAPQPPRPAWVYANLHSVTR